MKALIGTTNLGKIQGAKEALEYYFNEVEIEGIKVSSDVANQPLNEEIYEGARNRVNHLIDYAKSNQMEVDYFLGIESGIMNLFGNWILINIAVIKDKNGYESIGTSAGFPVPSQYVEKIISTDLGQVMDSLFEHHEKRETIGGIHLLTDGIITRIDLTRESFLMALIKQLNEVWTDRASSK